MTEVLIEVKEKNGIIRLPSEYNGGQIRVTLHQPNGREITATCASLKAAEDWTRQWKVALV